MMELVLILETENDKEMTSFDSTNALELYLKTIDLIEYSRSNILLYIDGEMNLELMKLFKARYLA
jgi:hypothetical protein